MGCMTRTQTAQDDADTKPADELIGNTVKGAVPDLDPSKWSDESGDGDPAGPDKPKKKRKPAKKSTDKKVFIK